MTEFTQALAAMLLVAGGLFVVVSLSTFFGGVVGWVVGMVFDDTIVELKRLLGTDISDFGLGAMLGFVGGFFRTNVRKSSS